MGVYDRWITAKLFRNIKESTEKGKKELTLDNYDRRLVDERFFCKIQ